MHIQFSRYSKQRIRPYTYSHNFTMKSMGREDI